MSRTQLIPDESHPITVEPDARRVRVSVGETVLVDTTDALVLREASYPEVAYVPLDQIDQSRLRRIDTHTYCPYKGEASYYDIVTDDGSVEGAVWTYERPYDAVASIAGHAAFYPDRVQIEIVDN
ncbi:DUF427 domain-containing protein [Gordonia soli]|uniref:DUF427 domain-containing protein n=1 Tax=Gordonia soli NBRC 108243 TaxID=1223545 RepID=M0QM20_9ACTN|nr:DUF427 domain-containing protein [Gordonia soli]GAC68432.1 hypothetical protein GS4_15_00820 [Gordonia soli NBRC 108243]